VSGHECGTDVLLLHSVEFADDAPGAGKSKAVKRREKQLKKKKKSGGFQSLDLSPEIYRGVMRLGYSVPTPIQRAALPVALTGQDVVAMARTGVQQVVCIPFHGR